MHFAATKCNACEREGTRSEARLCVFYFARFSTARCAIGVAAYEVHGVACYIVVLPAKGVWRAVVKRSPTGFQFLVGGYPGSPLARQPGVLEEFPYRERARWALCAVGEVEPGSDASTSQLTLGRSPTRGGAAASWDKFENLSGAGCAVLDSSTWKSTARWRAALPQRGYLTQPGVATFCGYPGLVGP